LHLLGCLGGLRRLETGLELGLLLGQALCQLLKAPLLVLQLGVHLHELRVRLLHVRKRPLKLTVTRAVGRAWRGCGE